MLLNLFFMVSLIPVYIGEMIHLSFKLSSFLSSGSHHFFLFNFCIFNLIIDSSIFFIFQLFEIFNLLINQSLFSGLFLSESFFFSPFSHIYLGLFLLSINFNFLFFFNLFLSLNGSESLQFLVCFFCIFENL